MISKAKLSEDLISIYWDGWKLCLAARMPLEILNKTGLGGAATDEYASVDKG